MKRFLLIAALAIALISPASIFAGTPETKTCELPQKTAYTLEYQGIGFFSNLVVALFGKSIFEDSKTFTIEESPSCQTQREFKIANPKKILFFISRNGETYSGTTNFKEKTELKESVTKDIFALADFLKGNLKAGDAFSMAFTMNSKNYRATMKVASLESCKNGKGNCLTANVSALIAGKDGEKLISVEAKIEKDRATDGEIKNIEIKTLFWPAIIIRISEKI